MKERKFRSYLTVEFPDDGKFTEEHIERLKKELQEMLSICNRGAIVKKVDYITSNNANVPTHS